MRIIKKLETESLFIIIESIIANGFFDPYPTVI